MNRKILLQKNSAPVFELTELLMQAKTLKVLLLAKKIEIQSTLQSLSSREKTSQRNLKRSTFHDYLPPLFKNELMTSIKQLLCAFEAPKQIFRK